MSGKSEGWSRKEIVQLSVSVGASALTSVPAWADLLGIDQAWLGSWIGAAMKLLFPFAMLATGIVVGRFALARKMRRENITAERIAELEAENEELSKRPTRDDLDAEKARNSLLYEQCRTMAETIAEASSQESMDRELIENVLSGLDCHYLRAVADLYNGQVCVCPSSTDHPDTDMLVRCGAAVVVHADDLSIWPSLQMEPKLRAAIRRNKDFFDEELHRAYAAELDSSASIDFDKVNTLRGEYSK